MNRTDHHPQKAKKNHKQHKPVTRVDNTKAAAADAQVSADQNQGDDVGEGNRAAARRYNEGLAQSEARGDSDALAEEAKEALDGDEGPELEEADEKGKAGEPAVTPRQ